MDKFIIIIIIIIIICYTIKYQNQKLFKGIDLIFTNANSQMTYEVKPLVLQPDVTPMINDNKKIFTPTIENIYTYKLHHLYKNTDNYYSNNRIYNKIPLVAFTCWHSKNVLFNMYNTILKNISNNPEIDFYIYDNNEASNFIINNFDSNVIDAYNKLIPDSYKSDLLRYCLLYINGGIYFDIKFIFNVSLINLIAKYQSIFVKDFNHCDNATLTGFIITEPKNPIFLDCINEIIININTNNYGLNPLYPTGPCLIGSILTKKYKNIVFKLKIYKILDADTDYVVTDLNDVNNIILTPYHQYRNEQKKFKNNIYYTDLWKNKSIYIV
jgi:hypothetical protein